MYDPMTSQEEPTQALHGIPITSVPLSRDAIKVACSNCNLRELCMPVGLSPEDLVRIDEVVAVRRRIKRGTELFHAGEKFTSLYAIRSGFFKTCLTTEDGRDQVTGFQMAGEIIGLDGIVNDKHTCSAVALEDAEVCVMPFDRIEELSREVNALQHHVHKIMSREIVREHGVMLLLGSMRAEERLAAFLLNLVQRLQLSGSQAGDGEPHFLALCGRWHRRGKAALRAHRGHRCSQTHCQQSVVSLSCTAPDRSSGIINRTLKALESKVPPQKTKNDTV
jgi:CRP/FNR family transcriptional regulator, anaerobic regulatory protein